MFAEFLKKHDLRDMVRPGLPYPAGARRAAWENIPMRALITQDAREAALRPYPLLTASDFMAYVRTGNRQTYEAPYFERRQHLIRTAIGECVQWDGAFVDDVLSGLWLLAEETSWVVSAHNVDAHPGSVSHAERPLPDKENPVIDLFAAQTAATVTFCAHLLAEKLDQVTPMICRRMKDEIEQRILRPFFHRDDFWWMGMIGKDVNNWTPWIVSNILTCLLHWQTDVPRLAEGIARAMRMLDRYLETIPNDGGCDEGAGYWNMSGASLLDCLELIGHATRGQADFYDQPKVRAMAAFPVYAHIDGPYFWNFADCDAKPMLDGDRMRRFGVRVGNARLIRLGEDFMSARQCPWPPDTPQMSRTLDFLLCDRTMAAQPCAQETQTPDNPVVLPELQVWACRKGPYYAAIKGGNNGENHNHNDVGSFLLYVDGRPAVVDAGNMAYTSQTFSDRRYALWNTRSRNHNLALIAGYEQHAGAAYRAEAVRMDGNGVCMELRHCYPEKCGLTGYERHAWLREDGFTLEDRITLEQPADVEWVFLLREEPCLREGACVSGNLRLTFPAALQYRVEAYPVTDARMKQNYPGMIWRLTLISQASPSHHAEFIWRKENE